MLHLIFHHLLIYYISKSWLWSICISVTRYRTRAHSVAGGWHTNVPSGLDNLKRLPNLTILGFGNEIHYDNSPSLYQCICFKCLPFIFCCLIVDKFYERVINLTESRWSNEFHRIMTTTNLNNWIWLKLTTVVYMFISDSQIYHKFGLRRLKRVTSF